MRPPDQYEAVLDQGKCFMLVVLAGADRASQCEGRRGWDVLLVEGQGYLPVHDLEGGWCMEHAKDAAADLNAEADRLRREPVAIRRTERRFA